MNRREMIGGLAGLGLTTALSAAGTDIPYRTLGRTGEKVSAIGLGGSHIGKPKVSEDESLRIIRTAIDRGINFMDNSWDYNQGQSEARMGKALRDGYRQKVFLMTKIDGRDKQTAAKQLDESMQRLQVDSITGHKDPHVHLYMLETARRHEFTFDTVQMPLNVMDAHFRSFEKLVVPEAVKLRMGILGMNSMGSGVILRSNTATPLECLHYAMNLPTSVVITGIDSRQILDQACEAARTFQPLHQNQVASILSKTAQAAMAGKYELFKTSQHFDTTAQHPEWLGPESDQVKQLAPA